MTNGIRHERSKRSAAGRCGVLALLFLFAGCSNANPAIPVPAWAHVQRVTGKVTAADGAPVSGGKIVLTPQQEPREPLSGWLDSDGSFTLMENQGLGISHGEFLVHIEPLKSLKAALKSPQSQSKQGKTQKGGPKIPTKYQQPETSGIKVTISADTKQLPPIQLK